MRVHCSTCHEEYDDTYRDTGCPHDKFNMHTIMAKGHETFVVTTLDDMEAVAIYFRGTATTTFYRLQANKHIHGPNGICLSRDTSGRLIEDAQTDTVL